MNKNSNRKKHGKLRAILNNKCPQCREGNIFQTESSYDLRNFMKMHEKCLVCGQITEIENGFYYGTGYISYAITVAFSVLTFVPWWILIGFSVDDSRIFWWLGTNAVLLLLLQPYLMRLSRTAWLSFFVKFNPVWRSEKIKMIVL